MSDRPKAIGGYVFAGGFTEGVRKYFDVRCHLEGDGYGAATARLNFPGLPIIYGPDKWPIERLQEEGQQHEWDFIFGNPPCAAWSVAGAKKNVKNSDKWRGDPRVECTVRHFGLLKALRPKVWAWESVTQAYTQGFEFVRELESQARDMGYSVTHLLHNAEYLGLPQVRKRYFMICHKIDIAVPSPNWAPAPTPLDVLPAEAIGEPHNDNWGSVAKTFTAEVIEKIPPGSQLSRWWADNLADKDESKWERNSWGGAVGRPAFGYRRLPTEGPARTVAGYPLIHPTQHRFISSEEMQLLCGFPPDFMFAPRDARSRAHEVVRGVCPPVGEWLAKMVAEAVNRNKVIDEPFIRDIDFRVPPEGLDDDPVRMLDPDRPVERPEFKPVKLPKVRGPGRPSKVSGQPRDPVAYRTPTARAGVKLDDFIGSLIFTAEFTDAQIAFIANKAFPESATGTDAVADAREALKADPFSPGVPGPLGWAKVYLTDPVSGRREGPGSEAE